MLLPPNWEVSLERIARLLSKKNAEKYLIPTETTDVQQAANPSTPETTFTNSSADEPSETSD